MNREEKKWIAYQFINAVKDAHFYGICHGDLKTENVMLTSWHWVYLTDFASFKPTYMLENDISDWSYFFKTSGRTCYLAPERFYSNSIPEDLELNPKMDVFSLGFFHSFFFHQKFFYPKKKIDVLLLNYF